MKPAAGRRAWRSLSRQARTSSGSRVSTTSTGPTKSRAFAPGARASSSRTKGVPACQKDARGPSRGTSGECVLVSSVFDLFKIGVGPSSSHTMGPMTAAYRFVETLTQKGVLDRAARVQADLYGSLALTGKGHATDRALLLGLSGQRPDRIDPDEADKLVAGIRETGRLSLGGRHDIAFDE